MLSELEFYEACTENRKNVTPYCKLYNARAAPSHILTNILLTICTIYIRFNHQRNVRSFCTVAVAGIITISSTNRTVKLSVCQVRSKNAFK